MQPFGKTYLIKCKNDDYATNVGGIFVLNEANIIKDTYWKGYVEAYGTGWTDDEKQDLVPIGSQIIMTYGKKTTSDKGGVKLVIGNDCYYIRSGNEIIGVIEDE